MRRGNSRRAFTLLEVLTVLLIAPVFLLLATKLFHTTFRTAHGSEEVIAAQATFDSAARALRGDLWSARAVSADPSGLITITPAAADGAPVTWTRQGTQLLRQGPDDLRRWTTPERLPITVRLIEGDVVIGLQTGRRSEEVRVSIPPQLVRRPS